MKRLFRKSTLLGFAVLSVLGGAACLVGCSGSSNNPTLGQFFFTTPTPSATTTAASPTFTQVEEFGRPAINEGLFITNNFLNAYNAAPPEAEAGAIFNANGTLTAFGTEAATTLTVLEDVSTRGQTDNANDSRIVDEVFALIPDVQRIDTTISSPVHTPAYANDPAIIEHEAFSNSNTLNRAVPAYMPRAGRKLEDDVVDITYTVLTDGAVTSDGVYFNNTDNPAQTTHQLNDQVCPAADQACTTGLCPDDASQEGGRALFPFEGPPN